MMKAKLGDITDNFPDNFYCRYLIGYNWDLKICEEKMTGMAVRT
jgi:hypothetical protein